MQELSMQPPTKITNAVIAVAAALGLAACSTTVTDSSAETSATKTSSTTSTSSGGAAAANAAASSSKLLADNVTSHAEADDAAYDSVDATIALKDGASTTSSDAGVAISGDTITISAPGTYQLSGTLSNGSLVVASDAEGKVRLVLDNASITNSAGAAIAITAADEVVVVLADGTTNALADGTAYDTSAEDAPECGAVLDGGPHHRGVGCVDGHGQHE
jgi:lipopolysaccharide export system protein LptA